MVHEPCSRQIRPLVDRFEPTTCLAEPSTALEASNRHRNIAQSHVVQQHQSLNSSRLGSTGFEKTNLISSRTRARIEPLAASASLVEPQGDQHVGHICCRSRAVAEQLICTRRRPTLKRTWHSEEVNSALGGFTCRDQAAAPLTALHHHQHLDKRRENTVSEWEPERIGLGARRPLGDQRTTLGHLIP